MLSSSYSTSPFAIFSVLWKNRSLISRLTRREVEARYRGSGLGILWTILMPILLLTVYTFVFSVVFESKWELPVNKRGSFALVLFAGLILYNVFAESISRAPSLMLSNISYIKKVVFPLEILPIVVVGGSIVNAAISLMVLGVFYVIILGTPPLLTLLVPLALVPVILMTLGLSWFLASVGVFIRDLQQIIGVALMLLLFLSPIFYPVASLPGTFRQIVKVSPISVAIENVRQLLFFNSLPDPLEWTIYLLISWIVAWLGYLWFMKTRKGFADVL